MRLKTLSIVAGVLVVLAAGGVIVQKQLEKPVLGKRVGTPLLKDIDMSRAKTISIDSGGDQVTMLAKDGGWIIKEQDNFPASPEKIRRFLFKLSGEQIELKVTENPKKLAALGLLTREENNGKTEQDKTATRFTVSDTDGKPLFELLLGIDRIAKGKGMRMNSGGGQYVRYPGEKAAYLIPDPLYLDTKPKDWLKGKAFTFGDDKLVKTIRIQVPGAKELVLSRPDKDSDLQIAGVPKDKLDKHETDLLARRLRDLEIAIVAEKGRTAKDLGREKVGVVTFDLFDQRSFRIEVGTKKAHDDYRFVTISGSLPAGVSDAKLKEDVDDLNSRFAKRIVGIYNWDGEQMLKARKDFIKAEKKDKKK